MSASRDEINMRRIHRRVRVDVETGCWHWLGKMRGNMPIMGAGRRATKWAWRKMKGVSVSKGTSLRRTCKTVECVNPAHMEEYKLRKGRSIASDASGAPPDFRPRLVKQALSTGDVGRISFLRKVLVQSDGHWLWRGREHEGVPVTKRNGNPHASAALVAWTLWKGHTRIPEGKRLARMCDESRCVAPEHFALVNR